MAFNIVQTPLFGEAEGDAFNDITTVGSWPVQQTIRKISKVIVRHGGIVDNITVTYDHNIDIAPTTVSHGGTAGNETVIALSESEFLIGVYGQYGFVRSDWGPSSIHKLQLVILNKATGNVRLEGPFGDFNTQGTPFYVSGPVIAFAGYSRESTERPQSYLQALSVFTSLVNPE